MATDKIPASADATIAYIKAGNPSQRVVIHYHPRKTYGPKLREPAPKGGFARQRFRYA
jgi:hypothetical protein